MHPVLNIPLKFPLEAYAYGKRSSGETHGVVLTKPHIVDLILDLADYSSTRDLSTLRILEPSCGTGAFLAPIARRLVRSARRHHKKPSSLSGNIIAFDIDPTHVATARKLVEATLNEEGIGNGAAKSLAHSWIRHDDFLLAPLEDESLDAIVGNPPYIRIEQLAPSLQKEYRQRFESLYDRADIYVAFIERSLNLLKPNGTLSFICADRWTLNHYGAPLREIISSRFRVRSYIDLHQASPFESEVIAYPSIFAISPGTTDHVSVGKLLNATSEECSALAKALHTTSKKNSPMLTTYKSWFHGDEPWVLTPPKHLRVLRDLESRFQPLESSGHTSVRIGVATGNDAAYIVGPDTKIEKSRLVPLVMRADIRNGRIANNHRFVINTCDEAGRPIRLSDYPCLQRHLEAHEAGIKHRHVAQKNPATWFRTIDRVYPELVATPKLLIPDIAGSNEVALDQGNYYPHHNLYFVISQEWDLSVLGALLSSRVALFFIWSYATKMRGSYLRFQAQYLRRIRVPSPSTLSKKLSQELRMAFSTRDFEKVDSLALRAYGLTGLPAFDFVDTRK